MSEQWFYGSQGQPSAPVDRETLRRMIVTGQVRPDDMVWTKGMPQWAPAQTVSQLMVAATPIPKGYDATGPQLYIELAGFWRRLVATFIDAVVIGVLVVVAGLIIPLVVGSFIDASQRSVQLRWIITLIVISWAYYAMMECSPHQATLGKLAVGIFVTDEMGEQLSLQHSLGRSFAKIISALILMIGFLMAAFTQRKQALHDLIAGTLVVRRK